MPLKVPCSLHPTCSRPVPPEGPYKDAEASHKCHHLALQRLLACECPDLELVSQVSTFCYMNV